MVYADSSVGGRFVSGVPQKEFVYFSTLCLECEELDH